MRSVQWLLLVVLIFTTVELLAVEEDPPPNILWIVSDDQRADTIAALGNATIKTPTLDRLVRQGISFQHAYCMGSTSVAVCAPSRYMMMTGRSLHRLPGNIYNIPVDEVTLPQKLRQGGWKTFFTGKWHSGKAAFARSFSDGGEIFFGGMGSHTRLQVHDYQPDGKYSDEDRHPLPGFSSTTFADAAIKFIEEQESSSDETPFLACVFFTAPHDPRTPPQKFQQMYPPSRMKLPTNFLPAHPFDNGELRVRDEKLAPFPRTPQVVKEHLGLYYGMISQMDEQIGRVLDALEKSGLAKNTLVIFTSDHGLAVGSHGLLGKQNLYEHSMRVPMVIQGPGIEAGRESDQPIYLHDLVATISEAAGIDPPESSEGRSFLGTILGHPKEARKQIYTAYKGVQRAIRHHNWKLIRYPAVDRTQLFDLDQDPYETTDLSGAEEHQGKLRDLLDRLHQQRKKNSDPLLKDAESR
ncbi:MAG: sulfatase-like hydrolase/transferase [Planctomycetota bacterium]|nr:sulfatase-like hydrolase/transferase [Planctomycetota bacterium]